MPVRYLKFLPVAALCVSLVELTAESLAFAAARWSAQARIELDADRHIAALESAEAALRLNPSERAAAYSRCVALKRLGRWDALTLAAAQARGWSPDGYSLLLLEGEAAFAAGNPGQGAEALWLSFLHTPRPKFSAAQLWRMAMLAGRDAWGADDPRTQAAAAVVLRLAPEDPQLSERDRGDALREAAAIRGAELHLPGREHGI